MFAEFEVPRVVDVIFCTAATSSIAFTAPPAITPVPSDAGLRRTSPAPALPTTGWCILPVLVRGILIRFFRSLSKPFWMASETSFALPSPCPTTPSPFPTTTMALKLNLRPLFTTLATRLMCTNFSSRFRLPAGILCLRLIFGIILICFKSLFFLREHRVLLLSLSHDIYSRYGHKPHGLFRGLLQLQPTLSLQFWPLRRLSSLQYPLL